MKRKRGASIAVLLLPAALLVQATALAKGPPKPPPAPQIPGLTATDPHPRSCVDCHIVYPQMKMDTRLSTLMKRWVDKVDPKLIALAQAAAPAGVRLKGKHPKVAVAGKRVPQSCLGCHKATSTKAPPFGRMLHLAHLVGGEQNHYITVFQGRCTHCHKLDPANGRWSAPSGVER